MREKIAAMSVRPLVRRFTLVALLLALPRVAGAVCTAQDITAVDPSCPPTTGNCTISGIYTVENGCTLDFGARIVSLTGRLNIKSRSATIRAGNFAVASGGVIDALGDAAAARGGTVVIETTGPVTTAKSSRIDASGNMSGGEIIIRAGTFLNIAGAVQADNLNIGAAGGVLDLNANGDINVVKDTSTVSARGGSDSDGGGEIDLTAGGNISVQTDLRVDALDGGFVEIRAEGTVNMTGADASGGGDAGSGGCIDITGGAGTTITGDIVADGATGTFMTGGCGGLICLDGDTGTMTVSNTGFVSANGASPDGGGGQISLLSLGSIVVAGTLQARGPDGETCGGDVCVDSGLDATVNASGVVDVSGGDAGGAIEFISGRNITVDGDFDLRGRQQAALGGDAALRAGNNGAGQLRVTATIDASSAPVCSVEDGCGSGGSTDLFGCDVTVTNGASLVATGPDGGQHSITAREQLRVQGVIDATRTVGTGSNGITRIQHTARKAPNLTGANINPAAQTQALATCPTQGPTMPTCLDPCPTCGNGQIEYPETCDLGVMPPTSCNGCSVFCKLEDCNDRLTCTGDQCLPTIGCRHRITPVCTEPPTPTPTITGTRPTMTSTATPSATRTATATASVTATPIASATITATPSRTPTSTGTATATQTDTPVNTATPVSTATPTDTATAVATATAVDTATPVNTATSPPTATASATATATPEDTATATASATATNAAPACAGDCSGDGSVAINELIAGVNIALGNSPVSSCPAFDRNGDGTVAINELIAAVNAALNGC